MRFTPNLICNRDDFLLAKRSDVMQGKMDSQRIVIAVDLDYFFAQCEEVRNPELKKIPVVICVFSGRTEVSGAVSTANYVARKLGVRSGMPIANAKKLLSQNKESVFLPVDQDYYQTVSERLMQTIRSFSAIFEQVSVDEAFIDISAVTGTDFEAAAKLGKTVKEEIYRQENLTCSVGIGPNKLIAKMAADYEKPDGLTIIRPNQVKVFLNPMPVRKLLGIGPKHEQKMEQLGISTIEDLSKFDTGALSDAFGKNLGPHFKNLAQGLDDDPVRQRSVEQLSRIVTLKEDADSFWFEEDLRPLAADISDRLVSLGLKCRSIGIIGITSELKTRNRAKTLTHPINSSELILRNSAELFRDLFSSLATEHVRLRRAGIRVSALSSEELGEEEESEEQSTLTSFLSS